MTSPITSLARWLAPSSPHTAAQPSVSAVPGAPAIVTGFNADGTLQVTYNGGSISVETLTDFKATAGQTVLVLEIGTQFWALGPAQGDPSGVIGITSNGKTIAIENPNGPIVNLEIEGGGEGDLPWFDVTSFGADPKGVGDSTTAINNAITAASNAGGGTVFFPIGVYIYTGGLVLPRSTTPIGYYVNPPSPGIFRSAPIRMTGLMSSDKDAFGDIPTFGAIIQFTPSASSTMITGFGAGSFEFDHLTVYDASNLPNLFFRMTNTVSHIHDNTFCGNAAFTSAQTDLIAYGFLNATAPNGANGIFQGYGTTLQNNTLLQMRHLAGLFAGCNQILIKGNALVNTCGWSAAAGPLSNQAVDLAPAAVYCAAANGNNIESNDIELAGGALAGAPVLANGYQYALLFQGSNNNLIQGNGFYDSVGATAGMFFDANSYGNVYIPGVCGTISGGYLPWGAGSALQQISMGSGGQGGTGSNVAMPFVPIGGIIMWPTTSVPFGYFLCDGASFDGQEFPLLAEILGGTTLPNLDGVFPLATTSTPGEINLSGTEINFFQIPSHEHGPGPGSVDYLTGGNSGANITTGGGGYGFVTSTGENADANLEAYWPNYYTLFFIMRGV